VRQSVEMKDEVKQDDLERQIVVLKIDKESVILSECSHIMEIVKRFFLPTLHRQ
jgi:hypothetical protein